jgi:hypothetical protein
MSIMAKDNLQKKTGYPFVTRKRLNRKIGEREIGTVNHQFLCFKVDYS